MGVDRQHLLSRASRSMGSRIDSKLHGDSVSRSAARNAACAVVTSRPATPTRKPSLCRMTWRSRLSLPSVFGCWSAIAVVVVREHHHRPPLRFCRHRARIAVVATRLIASLPGIFSVPPVGVDGRADADSNSVRNLRLVIGSHTTARTTVFRRATCKRQGKTCTVPRPA